MFSRFDFRKKTATKSNKKEEKRGKSDIFSSPHLRGRRDFFLSEKKDDGWIPSFFFFSPKKNWRKYKSGRDLNDGKALIFTEEQQRKFQQQRRRRCKYPPSNFSKIVWEIVGRGQKVFLAIKMRPPPARREVWPICRFSFPGRDSEKLGEKRKLPIIQKMFPVLLPQRIPHTANLAPNET